ncbi:hypothetical protein [Microtetraspora sp. NBRC 16547]|nr:hypothetical protein [Microtetraspora sp. NBRC 16547]GLW98840.1 hypothetical protein Misp02_29270 [Microtetraspora sp. NBRC 16547]
MLWGLLALGLAGNMAASSNGLLIGNAVFGPISLASAIALIVHHYRNRHR